MESLTDPTDLLSGQLTVYSWILPISGMTRNGLVFARPTPELHTPGSGSSYLPTPRASDTGTKGRRASEGFRPPLSQVIFENVLLPTPAAMNPNDGESLESWEARRLQTKERVKNGNGFGTPLAIAVQLLPTPVANDSGGTPGNHLRKKPGRTQVTSLQIITGFDLLRSGGHIVPPLNAGSES